MINSNKMQRSEISNFIMLYLETIAFETGSIYSLGHSILLFQFCIVYKPERDWMIEISNIENV